MKKWKREWCDKKAALVAELTMNVVKGCEEYRQASEDRSNNKVIRVNPMLEAEKTLIALDILRGISESAYRQVLTYSYLSENIEKMYLEFFPKWPR